MAELTYEYDNELEKLLMQNGMGKKVRRILSKVLSRARTRLSRDIQPQVGNDPRKAYKAVRRTVYKRILGGNLSILDKRRHGAMKLVEPPRKLKEGQRGGNRMPRSQRTENLMSYYGSDRSFILRFLNSGTSQRTDKTRSGNRGSITAHNFFLSYGQKEMEIVMEEFCKLIDEEYNKDE